MTTAHTPTSSFLGDRLHDDKIKEDITCKSCGEQFRGDRLPKILPCLHTVCSICVNKSASGQLKLDKVKCPLCKVECVCPGGSISNFRTSSFLQMLIDIVECHELEKQGRLSCIGCQAPARYRCLSCNENYCQSHTDFHVRSRATADHKVLTFKQILKSPRLISTIKKDENCEAHPSRIVDLFCFDCKAPVCTACALSTHKTHNCEGVSEAIIGLKKKFEGAKPKFNQKIYGLRQRVSTLQNDERQLDIDTDNALKSITDMIEKCVRELRQKEMLLSHAIEDQRKDNIVELKIQIAAIEEEIHSIESGVEFVDNVFDNWNALEVLSIESNIVCRLNELSVTELSLEPVTVDPMEFACDNQEDVKEAIMSFKNTSIDHEAMQEMVAEKGKAEKEEKMKRKRSRRKGRESVTSVVSEGGDPFFMTEENSKYAKNEERFVESAAEEAESYVESAAEEAERYVESVAEEGEKYVEYEPETKPIGEVEKSPLMLV